nr:SnoaL-like domain-containing protein [Sphingomonas sp.]
MGTDAIDRRTALAVPILLTASAADASASTQSAESVLLQFLRDFENCDLPRMDSAFAPDATYFDRSPAVTVESFEPYRRGRGMPAGMRKLATELPKTKPGPPYHRVQPIDLLTQSTGRTAIFTFHLEGEDSLGRRTVVLERRSNGWKIIHIHASNIQRQG